MSRRARYALIAAVVVLAVAAVVVTLLKQRPGPQARLSLDARAQRPESPAVSARYAAWTDRPATGPGAIMLFDSTTGATKRISPADADCSQPAISGDTVVYVDRRSGEGDLYRYDAASGESQPFVRAPGRQGAPFADGDWVVWEDDRTGFGPRVRARRLSGGAEVTVPSAKPGAVQRRPQVGGGFVVFEEYDGAALGAGNASIQGYDLVAGKLEAVSTSPTVHLLPATDGRQVVWCEQRGDSLDVVVLDRRTGARSSPPVPCVERTTPAVSSGVVYWVERCGRGHFDVYSWRPGETTITPLPGPGSIDRLDIRAGQGSRVWFEVRRNWYVRAELAGAGQTRAAPARVFSAPSGPISASRPSAPRLLRVQDTLAPTAPKAPVASASGTSAVVVDWAPSMDDERVTGYDVYRHAVPITTGNLAAASKVASVAAPPATVAVAPDEAAIHYTLYYAVVARDAAGNTALSANTVPDPHGTSAGNTETCQRCHLTGAVSAPNPAIRQACYRCHGGTPTTTQYGARAPFDVQAALRDDTGAPVPSGLSRHRNGFMTDNARECDGCHTPHRKPYDADPSAAYTKLLRTQLATSTSGQSGYRYDTAAAPVGNAFCFDCHGANLTPIALVGGSTAYLNAGGDHETGWAAGAHGTKVAAPSSDPGIQCEACHDKHGSAAGRLLGRYDPASGTNRIAATVIGGNDEGVCLACHGGASAGFPVYSRDASGFPVGGTWPGSSFWMTPYDPVTHSGSVHSGTGVVWPGSSFAAGDCKNCHRMHGPSNRYDILRDTDPAGGVGAEPFTSADFSFCFGCHDGSPGSDVRRYYPMTAGGTSNGARAGHATRSGGTLPAGSALPCYDCHDPHGSASAFGLLVVTQLSSDSTVAIGDAPGELTMIPGRGAAEVRRFCLCCHTTSDNASGWNGTAFAGVTSGAKVEGIDRVLPSSRLRLPGLSGHASTDAQSCYTCHGNDYGPAGSNVHAPGGGVSSGGTACYTCHSGLRETMDASGTSRTSWYHHVLGTGGYTGDLAPGTGSYPATLNAAAQAVYCVSCHTDHNYFNAVPGANLRLGIGLGGSAATNTDFVPTAPYGICVSCHAVSFTRDNANQRAGGGPNTLAISGADFSAGTHHYVAPGGFGGSSFRADCSKCHDDGQPKSFQTPPGFSLHFSLDSRIAAAMGLSIPTTWTNAGSTACYKCHSSSTADNPNTTAGKDWYGVAPMTANALRMHQAVSQPYAHPVDGNPGAHLTNEATSGATWPWTSRHVTCEDCHDVHAAKSGVHTPGSSVGGGAVNGITGVKPSWTTTGNFTAPAGYAAVALKGGATDWEAYLCFKCHSSYGGTPSGTSPSGALRTNLAQEFNPGNFSYHRVLGTDMSGIKTSFVVNGTTYTWQVPSVIFNSPWKADYMLTCSDCHTGDPAYARGPHGSSVQFMIDPRYPVLWGTTNARLRSSAPGMNPQLICAKCHILFNGSTWGNNVHSRGDHQSVPCTYCHVGIPHGWKRPRLISYTTDPAPYGHPSGVTSMRLRSHLNSGGWQSGWQASDCGANCGEHNSSVSPAWP